MIRLQLRTRYALALLALLLATVGSLSVALLTQFSVTADNLREASAKSMDEALLRQYERRAEDLSVTLAETLVDAVYLLQVDDLAMVVDGLAARADVNAIAVFDGIGLLYYSGKEPNGAANVLESHFISHDFFSEARVVIEYHDMAVASSAPVLLNEKVIGHVMVDLSLAPAEEQIALARDEQDRLIGRGLGTGLWVSIGITMTFGGLGVILAVFLGDRMGRPIDALAKLARRIGQGDYDVPADIKGSGEVRDLIQSFHSMASDLRNTTVSKTHLDNILHGMLDGLLVVGSDGRIQTANRASSKLLGYEEGEIVGQPVSAFFAASAHADPPDNVNRPREGAARQKNGDSLPVLLSISSLRERSPAGGSTVWVFRDITSLKAAQDALVAAMRESERANRAKSQFLANMSHELRTPLNAIIGYSEMLAEDARERGQEAMTDDLGRIHTAGRHLLRLINDVLDLSKIEAGKLELRREEFLLQTVVEDVATTVRPMLEEGGNSLTINCPAALAPITTDPTKVRQILFNILSNAAKFTKGGSITVTVRMETRKSGEWISMDVADSGIGMSVDQLDRIFGEFIQADSSTTREYGGTGLGLAISRQLARMLGGEISAASTPDKGSVFTIGLPARMVDSIAATLERPEPLAAAPKNFGTSCGRVVLVVDKQPERLERIVRQVAGWGFGAVSANQGREGLRLARKLHPMAVLLDTTIVDDTGHSLADQLRDDPATADIPVIATPEPAGDSAGRNDLLDRLAALLSPPTGQSALVVDDDAHARRLMALSLESAGWKVAEAEHGQDAMVKIGNNVPDLIVLDLMMPVMDGETFLRELRNNSNTASVRVMIVTAKPVTARERITLQGNAETIIDKGADGWIGTVRIMSAALGQQADRQRAVGGE